MTVEFGISEALAPWPLTGRGVELQRGLEALASGTFSGIAVRGPSGVGRSRLAAELVSSLEAAHGSAIRVVASATARLVPLGPFRHLAAEEEDATENESEPRTASMPELVDRLRRRIERLGPVVVFVDDAHWLDEASLILLAQLTHIKNVRIVLTSSSGAAVPDGLAALSRTDSFFRIDISAFDFDQTGALLRAALGGMIDGRAEYLLFHASGGLPLLLRETVRTARDAGVLCRVEGVWRIQGPLPVARRATELAAAQL